MEAQTIVIQKQEGNGLAVAAMVLGIIGLVLSMIPFIPYPLAILAIVFGVIGMKKQIKKGFAVTGLITGLITIGLKVWFWIGLATLGTM